MSDKFPRYLPLTRTSQAPAAGGAGALGGGGVGAGVGANVKVIAGEKVPPQGPCRHYAPP